MALHLHGIASNSDILVPTAPSHVIIESVMKSKKAKKKMRDTNENCFLMKKKKTEEIVEGKKLKSDQFRTNLIPTKNCTNALLGISSCQNQMKIPCEIPWDYLKVKPGCVNV